MDRSIPAPAARILNFIGRVEAPTGYCTVYGDRRGEPLRMPNLTSMTINEVIADGKRRTKQYGSSAAGLYQFMAQTLKGLKKELGLSGDEKFDANMQDRLAFHLLKRRKWEQFEAGRIGLSAFAKQLAMEWASFPVLRATQGAHRHISRGESYYAGDKLNKALVPPEAIEKLLTPQPGQTTGAAPAPTTAGETSMEPVTPVPIPGTKKELLPVPQVTQNPLTSKTTIGTVMMLVGLLSTAFPNWIPATLVPLVETGITVVFGLIGSALTIYGRFTAQGPLKFVFGGGMSELSQLREQMAEMQHVVEQARAELAAAKAKRGRK